MRVSVFSGSTGINTYNIVFVLLHYLKAMIRDLYHKKTQDTFKLYLVIVHGNPYTKHHSFTALVTM